MKCPYSYNSILPKSATSPPSERTSVLHYTRQDSVPTPLLQSACFPSSISSMWLHRAAALSIIHTLFVWVALMPWHWQFNETTSFQLLAGIWPPLSADCPGQLKAGFLTLLHSEWPADNFFFGLFGSHLTHNFLLIQPSVCIGCTVM